MNLLDANFWLDLIKTQGVPIFLVIWFVSITTYMIVRGSNMFSSRIWPWMTETYFPAQETRRTELNATLVALTNAVTTHTSGLTALQAAFTTSETTNVMLLQATLKSIEAHDVWERSVFEMRYKQTAAPRARRLPAGKKAKAA